MADQLAVGGVQGADGGRREAGLDRLPAAARAPGLDRDPQVTGIAALQLGDDLRPGGEPPLQDLDGRLAERARAVGEVDAGLAVQVQGLDAEAARGPGPTGRCPRRARQRRRCAARWRRWRRAACAPPGRAAAARSRRETGCSRRGRLRCPGARPRGRTRRRRCRSRRARASSSGRRRRPGPRRVLRLRVRPAAASASHASARAGSSSSAAVIPVVPAACWAWLQVLLEEVPADSPGGDREPPVGQVTQEVVNRGPRRRAGIQCRHMSESIATIGDNSKKRQAMPERPARPLAAFSWSGTIRIGPSRTAPFRPGPRTTLQQLRGPGCAGRILLLSI